MAKYNSPDDPARQMDELFLRVPQLYDEGRYQEAIDLAIQVRDLARLLGKYHPRYATSLNNLAMLYQRAGDHAAALPLFRQALEIRRAELGEDDPLYAQSLNNLAGLYRAMGDHAAALPLDRQSLDIRRAARHKIGRFAPSCENLNDLAALYRAMGDHAAALPLFRQAVETRRAALGEDDPLYAQSLTNLAWLYRTMGDHAAALPLYRQALEIRRSWRDKGGKPDLYAESLNDLAALYRAMGDHAAALPLFRQALEICRTATDEVGRDLATVLNNLAGLYQDMGDYAGALPLYRQALEIRRATLDIIGEFAPYAESVNDLAVLYRRMGDHAAALPLFRQAVETRRAALGENHPDFAESLNSLAGLYQDMGDYVGALPLYRQALETRRAALGENHPDIATHLNNLAGLYQDMGDHAGALPLYRQALEIRRATLGENHPDFAESLNNLAGLYAAAGRASEARPLMEQAAAIEDRTIGQILAIGSERQRIAFLNTVMGKLYGFLSLALQHLGDSPDAIHAACELVLRRKAVAAEILTTQRDAVLGGQYPALKPWLREVATLRMQVTRKTLAGPGPEGPDAHLRELAKWNARKEELEAGLARQLFEMNLEQKLRATDRRAVALNLPEGVVLVEIIRFRVRDFQAVPDRGEANWKPSHYVAFVLPGGTPDDVKMIDLGEATPIDRLIADFRAGIIAEAETGDGRDMAKPREEFRPTIESDSGLALRAALFDRLVPALGSRTRLLIAPDGDLTRLPFETLPTADGRRLIDDYQISYLSCGRDVLRFGTVVTGQPGKPLVVADPDFDLEAKITTGPVPAKPWGWSRLLGRANRAIMTPKPSVPTPQTTDRHSRDLDPHRRALYFNRLPGTRAEGERVAAMLGVSPWLDGTALEGRLKTACRSPHILHLATHGFFLPDQEVDLHHLRRHIAPMLSGDRTGGDGRLLGPMMENPMLRSGLALAGANTWLRAGNPPEEAEDGLLTAEDVTSLDLLATELVVLSACETGLGQIHVGEGVFGLRRAFVLAGAQTLVMSLWKVPDAQTQELMQHFYRRLLAGEGRAEALRQAQLAMKAKYLEPFYWGAFICQGDPSALSTAGQESAGVTVLS
jgi:CHAT domain-containing protein/tetratricopeptide (TPR) repeat protein